MCIKNSNDDIRKRIVEFSEHVLRQFRATVEDDSFHDNHARIARSRNVEDVEHAQHMERVRLYVRARTLIGLNDFDETGLS